MDPLKAAYHNLILEVEFVLCILTFMDDMGFTFCMV